MAPKSIFLSLTRQIIFLIPLLYLLPPHYQLDGVWYAYPVSDFLATVVSALMLAWQIKRIRERLSKPPRLNPEY